MSRQKWLFEAVDDEQEIVVKFAHSYGEDIYTVLLLL